MNQSRFSLEIAWKEHLDISKVLQMYKDVHFFIIDTVEANLFLKCILVLKNHSNGFEFQLQTAVMNWQK